MKLKCMTSQEWGLARVCFFHQLSLSPLSRYLRCHLLFYPIFLSLVFFEKAYSSQPPFLIGHTFQFHSINNTIFPVGISRDLEAHVYSINDSQFKHDRLKLCVQVIYAAFQIFLTLLLWAVFWLKKTLIVLTQKPGKIGG